MSTSEAGNLCCISFHERDKIRTLNFPHNLEKDFKATIEHFWSKGIQSEKLYGPAFEYKLHGYPWSSSYKVESLYLVTEIFGFMLRNGWGLMLASKFVRKLLSKDSFFFKQQNPVPGISLCSLCFDSSNIIRIVNGPPEMAHIVESAASKGWSKGLRQTIVAYGVPEVKFQGGPFAPSGLDTVESRALIIQLLDGLTRSGWIVYAAIDLVGPNSSGHQQDCWILKKA